MAKRGFAPKPRAGESRPLSAQATGLDDGLRQVARCLEQQQFAEAEALLRPWLGRKLSPDQALRLLDHQAALALLQGQYGRVIQLLEPAEQRCAAQAGLLQNLASAYRNSGDVARAVALLQRVRDLNDQDPDVYYNLGNALRDQGELAQAAECFARSISLGNHAASAYNNLGVVLRDLKYMAEAEQAFRQGLALDSASRNLCFNLSSMLADLERHEEALQVLAQLPQGPDDADLLYNRALSLEAIGQSEAGLECLQRVHQLDPDRQDVQGAIGHAHQAAGRIREAIEAYRDGLRLDPLNTELHRRISVCHRYRQDDAHLQTLRQLASGKDLDDDSRMRLCFALAKAEEEVGRHREAFAFLAEANQRMAAQVQPFDLHGWLEHVSFMLELDRALISRSLTAADSNKGAGLVFIMGMPRSGTTLTENILSLAPNAVDLGESMALERSVATLAERWQSPQQVTVDDLELLGDRYLQTVGVRPSPEHLVTDKNLYNWRYAGLISRALPGAKIIHCCRNPVDNVLSIFKAYFPRGNEYAFDLGEIFQVYQLQDQTMAHYRRRYPANTLSSNYDHLVADPAARIPELVAFVGLAWDERYLHPEASQRKVRTASAVQVRSPIHARSVCGWKRYEPELSTVAQRFRDLGYVVD